MSIENTLDERGQRYGDFNGHARITQDLKDAMSNHDKWYELSPAHREALEMIAHKIGRIINGDPTYSDSWHDIQGYARLGEQACLPTLTGRNTNAPEHCDFRHSYGVKFTMNEDVPETKVDIVRDGNPWTRVGKVTS